jgi:hypothetical protein
MRFLHIIVAIWIVLTVTDCSHAKAWRGIVPLKSTRVDVERLLGPPTGDRPTYYLSDSTVDVQYAKCRCGDKCKMDGWNVPPDTVTLIRVGMKGVVKLADLKIDLTHFKRWQSDEDVPGSSIYKNEEDGFAIEAGGEYVSALVYTARAADDHLRCRVSSAQDSSTEMKEYLIHKFDEYSNIPFIDEKARLDNFAIYLQEQPSFKGYIIFHDSQRMQSGGGQARAKRAKNYLVSVRNIDSKRIVIINGGSRKEFEVELYALPSTMSAPTPNAYCNE